MSTVLMETGDSHSDEGQSSSTSTTGVTQTRKFSSVCEIEEENEMFEINNRESMPGVIEELEGSLFSFDFENGDDVVYVAVAKTDNDSSMDALVWTINHVATPSTLVFLIHVFPELRFIPTPLGKMAISQVNPEQKENHMNQERNKRREFLQKFLDVCSASKVKVDTILIESDMEAKAILDLIPILNIRKLVLGTNKSSLKKLRSRRGNGVADQVFQNAPAFCEVKIICEGKEVMMDVDHMMNQSPSPSSRGNLVDSPSSRAPPEDVEVEVVVEDQKNDSFGCACFKPKFML